MNGLGTGGKSLPYDIAIQIISSDRQSVLEIEELLAHRVSISGVPSPLSQRHPSKWVISLDLLD